MLSEEHKTKWKSPGVTMNRLTHMLPPNNGSVSLMLRDQCMHHRRYAIMEYQELNNKFHPSLSMENSDITLKSHIF
ncbi:hypothetical protein PVAP13_3NG061335 [Panicum virgatum]|uniref:Uncharacterized protein n=1 Tax=Panicum virgatum TaxID=38727 RepID=A0A8T0U2N6_PANVG|nr:hypothetical protein PVAP13_3NG061335 [Panicum virgatum]